MTLRFVPSSTGLPSKSTPERREGLRACYWEGPSELPERRSSSSAPRHGSAEPRPISRPTLEKNPMPGHLFEGNPVDEGTKRRVTDTPVHHSVKPQVPHTARQEACHPMNNSRGKQSSIPPLKTRPDSPAPTLKGPCDRSPKWRGTLMQGLSPFLGPPRKQRPAGTWVSSLRNFETMLSWGFKAPVCAFILCKFLSGADI